MTEVRKYYVYVHRRLTDGLLFYVGKGTGRRAYETSESKRSEFWSRIYRKHGRFVHILFDNLTNKEAIEIESTMIGHFSSCGCQLANVKDTDCEKEYTGARKIYCSSGDVFQSSSDAAHWVSKSLSINASQGNISSAARGERNYAYGYSWSYDGPPAPPKTRGGAVYCSNGMIFKDRKSALSWVVSIGNGKASGGAISNSCASDHKIAYGFKWSRDGIPKMPEVHSQDYARESVVKRCAKRCANSNGDEFESAAAAARHMKECGFPTAGVQSISAACTGRQPTAYGFRWWYV